MLQPLDYIQIAPRGFLLFEKLAANGLGTGDHALRLYSILTGLAALPLFYALARRVLSEHGALLAFAVFAVLSRPIFYSSEAKQYGGDIFFACLLLALAVRALTPDAAPRHWLRLGVLGAVAVWFSQPALFVLAGIATALLVAVARGKFPLRWPAIVACALWIASGLPSIYLTLHSLGPAGHEYMRSFWANGFWPIPPRSVRDLAWPLVNFYGLFRDPLGMRATEVGVVLAVVGAVVLARRNAVQLVALGGSLAAVYVASALGVYPFDTTIAGFNPIGAGNGRVLMFLLPAVILVVVAGAMALISSPLRYRRRVGLAAAALLVGSPLLYDLLQLPYTPHDLRPALDAMRTEAQAGDRLYVHYGARQAFDWYAPRFPVAADHVVRGGCYRPAWREYLRELDALRGHGRLWVFMVRPANVNGVPEGAAVESYLDQVAPRAGRWGTKDAVVLLYDFAAARPLAPPSSRWHPPPRRLAVDTVPLGFSCTGVFPGPGPQSP